MGMSDQYDDGRYDSLPEVPDATPGYTLKEAGLLIEGERYNPKTDQWLPAGDPRLPKYQGVERGHTELPGGWCIPNSQMPDLYYKITARDFHGTPVKITTEGNTMALTPKQKVRKLEAELDSNLTLQQALKKEEAALREDIRKADLPAPPPAHGSDMFQTLVQFTPGGSTYSYLLIRSGGRWYTTGTHEDQKMFKSWEALCAWLNSTYSHTNLTALMTTGLSFPTEYKTVRL